MVSLINSKLISLYVDNFVNNTQTFQINDARQLPIIIPTEKILQKFKEKFDIAYQIKIQQFDGKISDKDAVEKLKPIENQIDIMVYKLYDLTYDEILSIDKDFKLSEQEYNNYTLS